MRALSARQDSAYAALHRAVTETRRASMDTVSALSDQVFDFRGNASGRALEIERDLENLKELVAVFQRNLDQVRADMVLQGQQLEQRIAEVAEAGDSAFEGGEIGVEEPAASAGTPVEAQELFDMASTNAERGLYTTALHGFTRFLDQYPRDPLAPAAYLHKGEVLTLQDQREEAISAYLEVPKLFPTSEHIPAALYRAGALCIELEDFDRAREYLERLVNTYPEDAFAEQAREKLDDIP